MDQVEEIKKRIDIVEFIGQYLQLKKAGVNHSALCPFHGEKTPSFMVSHERQSFKCFGCGEGGDVITFFMKMEGFEFSEALRILGERVGVQVSFKPKEEMDREKTRRDRIFKINLLAAKYYKAVLHSKDGVAALQYLKGRGLSEKTIDKLKIGFAPGANSLEKYLVKYGFSYSEIGLAGHPERFRHRIIFPIFDVLGNIVGFSGRILESDLPKNVSPHPKYLNTPETPVFHKSRALYGINLAKDAIRQKKRAIVVEGQMDVASCHEAGIEEAVASSGTALAEDHLKTLGRYTTNIIFSFDEDEAGQKAARSAIEIAYSLDLEPRLTIAREYKDIGEMVEKLGNKAQTELERLITEALPPVEWLVKRMKNSLGDKEMSAQNKKNLARESVAFISRMNDEIEKAHYIGFLARILGVPEISIEKVMAGKKAGGDRHKPDEEKVESKDNKPNIEEEFLAYLIGQPEKTALPKINFPEDSPYSDLYKKLSRCYNSSEVEPCIARVAEGLARPQREKMDSLVLLWDKKVSEDREEASREFADLARKINEASREKTKSGFAQKIAEAESRGDVEEVKKLMQKLQESFKN